MHRGKDSHLEGKLEMRERGMTYAAIAAEYGVSKQSVHQLFKRWNTKSEFSKKMRKWKEENGYD